MGALWHENDLSARAAFEARLGETYMAARDAFIAELETAFADELAAWSETAGDLGVDAEAAIAFYQSAIAAEGN